jgi:hypothetical protein
MVAVHVREGCKAMESGRHTTIVKGAGQRPKSETQFVHLAFRLCELIPVRHSPKATSWGHDDWTQVVQRDGLSCSNIERHNTFTCTRINVVGEFD